MRKRAIYITIASLAVAIIIATASSIFHKPIPKPAEIQKLKEGLNATTVLIRRESVENNETSNASDANVFDYNYDLTIHNNSDIIDLENKAKKFIEYMRGAPHYEYDN